MEPTAALPTTELGETGMQITRIGLGAWAIGGGDYKFGWGEQDDADSVAAIHRALELGVNWIDTAAIYGIGRSERVVGAALAGLSERPYVFTKGSRVVGADGQIGGSLKRDSLRRELDASLERLGLDAVDLYQLHWPIPDEDIEEGWSALVELREEGLVRHIGVSNFDVEQLRRIGAIAPVETLQPPYSLVAREAEQELLPFCEAEGIGVLVYSPMGSGILTGAMTRERIAAFPPDDWRHAHPRFQEPQLTQNLELAQRLGQIGAPHGASPGAVAVAWTLANPAVDGAIVGFRTAAQVDDILAGAALDLSGEIAAPGSPLA
jgi:aryl-alcohol dehydrogenase-like predicted oxidoreductase